MTSTVQFRPARRRQIAAEAVTDPGGLVVRGRMDPVGVVPPLRLAPGRVLDLVRAAAKAPSVHNARAWKLRVSGNEIELYADTSKMLRSVDPAGRELLIGCGAALFGLRLGLRKLGYVPYVELLPDPASPWLAARVEIAGSASVTRQEMELLAAQPQLHTHRGAFSPGEVPARLLAALRVDAATEGTQLVLIEDAGRRAELADLAQVAAAEPRLSPGRQAELRESAQTGDSRARDDRPPPAIAVLTTPEDTATDWLRAGQALHRLLLHAATRWVFASLQPQPLEVPRCRGQVSRGLGLSGHPQMILQFGRANTAAPTVRRLSL